MTVPPPKGFNDDTSVVVVASKLGALAEPTACVGSEPLLALAHGLGHRERADTRAARVYRHILEERLALFLSGDGRECLQ